jgi:hypothetical protein
MRESDFREHVGRDLAYERCGIALGTKRFLKSAREKNPLYEADPAFPLKGGHGPEQLIESARADFNGLPAGRAFQRRRKGIAQLARERSGIALNVAAYPAKHFARVA